MSNRITGPGLSIKGAISDFSRLVQFLSERCNSTTYMYYFKEKAELCTSANRVIIGEGY